MNISDSIKRLSLPLLAAVLTAMAPAPSQAVMLDLRYASLATGEDRGPQDGVFDAFASPGAAGVANNGWTSLRTAMEFDLSALPANAVIHSATVHMAIGWVEGTRYLALHGYAGDGAVSLTDFSLNGLVGGWTLNPSSIPPTLQLLTFDASSFVRGLLSSGEAFAGFNLREDPPNKPNYLVLYFETRSPYYAPRLSVDYTVRPVPEPVPILLLAAGLMALALPRLRRRTSREAE